MPIVNIIKACINPRYRRLEKQKRLFKIFTRHHLNIFSWGKQEDLDSAFSMFITGSDQVWSPIYTPLTIEYQKDYSHYFLQFTNKKKVSYAPSIKLENSDAIPVIKKWLESYSHISVREHYGANSLREIIGRNVDVVLDPTLLMTGDEWLDAIKPKFKECQPYISCYFIRYNPSYLLRAKEMAAKLNVRIRIMTLSPKYEDVDCEVISAGPSEFLSEIKNCEYFFSDSFHGTVFSLLFNKQFLTFANEEKGAVNERITNILNMIGHPERLIVTSNNLSVSSFNHLDYDQINEIIKDRRKECITWLSNAINE